MKDTLNNVVNTKYIRLRKLKNKTVKAYCGDLDLCLLEIKEHLDNITDADLENYIIRLSNLLYWVCEGVENVGLKEDLIKRHKTEIYNTTKLNSKGTIPDKTASAELSILDEQELYSIYDRAYKQIKHKLDAGYAMLNCLKKVMNKRLAELELSNSKYQNRGINAKQEN